MTKLHVHPGDEILMAYADGELDEDVALALEDAMANDPALVKELIAFTRSRRLARAVMGRSHDEASMRSPAVASHTGPTTARWKGWLSWLAPFRIERGGLVTASVALLACGLGYLLAAWPATAPATTALAHLEDPDVAALLQNAVSGERHALRGATFNPLATYRLENGTLCRDYLLDAGPTAAEAIACRFKDGWHTVAAISKPATDGYTPASGEGVIDSYLQEIKAGDPLSEADERRLLSGK